MADTSYQQAPTSGHARKRCLRPAGPPDHRCHRNDSNGGHRPNRRPRTEKIARGGLVHLFGSGHSRIAVEEMFPRYGSFPGFHPIVELALSNYHQVLGTNGLQQSMFIENVEELGRNDPQELSARSRARPDDRDLLRRHQRGADRGCRRGPPRRADGDRHHQPGTQSPVHASPHRWLPAGRHGRILVIDTCTPPGDAGIWIDGLDVPVGPLSTLATVTIINMIKVGVAETLVERGIRPNVITSSLLVGPERSAQLFDAVLPTIAHVASVSRRISPINHFGSITRLSR